MEKSFDEILNKKYRVDLDSVHEALSSLGYKTGKSMHGILATKYVNGYRLHADITLLPTGQVDRYCRIDLHKDMGTHLFHRSIGSDSDIDTEFDLLIDILSNIIKRKNHENDMDINRKDVNNMLRDIDMLEIYFDYNHERIKFINKFRTDLNILFEMTRDNKEDLRRSLIVLLLDIVDKINLHGFKVQELAIIKDMTKSLLNPLTREKFDHYVSSTKELLT